MPTHRRPLTPEERAEIRAALNLSAFCPPPTEEDSTMTTITSAPQHDCPCCGQPIHHWKQPSMFADRPAHWYGECHTEGCALEGATLEAGKHALLTAEQIEAYRISKPLHRQAPVA